MFKLASEPTMYQLTVHINNLIAYWNVDNVNFRYEADKPFSYKASKVISTLNAMTQFQRLSIGSRKLLPLSFRCRQIVQEYGKEAVVNYIEEVYGKRKAS